MQGTLGWGKEADNFLAMRGEGREGKQATMIAELVVGVVDYREPYRKSPLEAN